MTFKKWVKSIQTTGYNGECMVFILFFLFINDLPFSPGHLQESQGRFVNLFGDFSPLCGVAPIIYSSLLKGRNGPSAHWVCCTKDYFRKVHRERLISGRLWSSTKKIESFKIEEKDGYFAIPDKAKRNEQRMVFTSNSKSLRAWELNVWLNFYP